tara:strand:- start:282 stop:536 length:255 start_codon:yes stop_codon:yes gene_type:complete
MPINKIKGVGAAVKGFGKAIKDFKSKRIAAINRKVKKSGAQPYIEEYGDIISSKAKNKKQYKAEQKAKREKFRKSLPKELPYDE